MNSINKVTDKVFLLALDGEYSAAADSIAQVNPVEMTICKAIINVRKQNFKLAKIELDKLDRTSSVEEHKVAVSFVWAEFYVSISNPRKAEKHIEYLLSEQIEDSLRFNLLLASYYLLESDLYEVPKHLSKLEAIIEDGAYGLGVFLNKKHLELKLHYAFEQFETTLGIIDEFEESLSLFYSRNDPQVIPILIAVFDSYFVNEKINKGVEFAYKAKNLADRLVKGGADSSVYSGVYGSIGAYEFGYNSNTTEGIKLFNQELSLGEENGLIYSMNYLVAMCNLASCFVRSNDYEKALEVGHKQVYLAGEGYNNISLHVLMTQTSLALIYTYRGDHNDALAIYYNNALIIESLMGKESLSYTTLLNNIGGVFSEMGLYQAALNKYNEAYEIEAKERRESRSLANY